MGRFMTPLTEAVGIEEWIQEQEAEWGNTRLKPGDAVTITLTGEVERVITTTGTIIVITTHGSWLAVPEKCVTKAGTKEARR